MTSRPYSIHHSPSVGMAKHKRDMSAFSVKNMATTLRLSPTSLRMRPRSPSKSPSRHSRSPTRSRITDDIFEDLTPAKILERFTSASGELAASIEAASPDQRQFGMRAAVASKKIEEWANEVGGWPWPNMGAEGFIMPEFKPGVPGDYRGAVDLQRLEEVKSDEEYWGSLPAALVRLYHCRISEILDDMDDLDIEEIKNKVLGLVAMDARPSSSQGESSSPATSGTSGYTRLDTFTGMITHTVLDALPKLHRLRLFLDIWSIRIDILRDVPGTVTALGDADAVLRSAWESLEDTNESLSKSPSSATIDSDEKAILTHSEYVIIQSALQEKVTAAGKKIDSMLDRLDGRLDTVPEPWLESMDAIETDYGNWTVAAERKVLEGEWALKAARKAKEMEAQQALAKKESIEHAAVTGNGSEGLIWPFARPVATDDDHRSLGDNVADDINQDLPITPASPQPLCSPLEALESQNNTVVNADLELDSQDQRPPSTVSAPSIKNHEDEQSPMLIARDCVMASEALPEPSLKTVEMPLSLGMSRPPSTERRGPPSRLSLPYQIRTRDSGPTSPEFYPSSPRPPSSSSSLNLRPFILNSGGHGVSSGSLPSSPCIIPVQSNRNSIMSETWNIGVDEDSAVADPAARGDSQLSSPSAIFPSLRGSPLFSGPRSSSINLGPSPSKRRSEVLFGNSEEFAFLAAEADDSALEAPNSLGPVVDDPPNAPSALLERKNSRGFVEFQNTFSPSCQWPYERDSVCEKEPVDHLKSKDDVGPKLRASVSDPFIDEPKVLSTPIKPATSAAPNTPPPISTSDVTHAIMSPSNQPQATCYYSDDDYPMSPTKKLMSPFKRTVLDDGGSPRSPKKTKGPLKEQTWLESSETGEDGGRPRSTMHRASSRPKWYESQGPAPAFSLKSPRTPNKASRSASSVENNDTCDLYGDKQVSRTFETSPIALNRDAKLLLHPKELTGTFEPKTAHRTDSDLVRVAKPGEVGFQVRAHEKDPDTIPTQEPDGRGVFMDGAMDNARVVSYASTVSGYSPSDLSPKIHEAEPVGYYKATISPVKTRGNWPDLSDTQSPIDMSDFASGNIFTPNDEAQKSPTYTQDRVSPRNFQLDEAKSDLSTHYGEHDFANNINDSFSDPPIPAVATIGRASSRPKQIRIPRRDTVVSTGLNIVTSNHSLATSPSKPSVFNRSIALESPRIVEDLVSDDDFNEESPTADRSRIYDNTEIYESIEHDFSAPNTPPPIPLMSSLRSFTRDNFDEFDSMLSEQSEILAADTLALEAPIFSNVDVDLAAPQGGPAKVSNDQLQQQISEILESIPAKIELSMAPISQQKSPTKPKHVVKKRPSRASLSPALRPTMYSRAPTPSFTLAPAKSRTPRPRQQNNSDIQLYHLMRSTDDAPIKLFVRLVGEKGERVMVRVGGGWADLGEYLKEYSSHHRRRAERGGEVNVELPGNNGRPRVGSISSLNPAPGLLRTGPNGNVWSSPVSRPGSSMGGRPSSSLQVRKRGARKSEGPSTTERSVRSPSTPLPFTSNTLKASGTGDDRQTPPVRSVSRQAWSVGPDGEEVHLGPSGPNSKRGELDEVRKKWVDSVVERVRQVSAEKTKDGFGALGQVGGTKRLFRKGA